MTTPRKARERAPVRHTDSYVLIAMPSVNRAAGFRAGITAGAFETVVVRDGEEARQQIVRRGAPVLLILDLSLPKVDGFELLKWLRGNRQFANLPTIILSSSGEAEDRERALALGASEYLVKPLTVPERGEMLRKFARVWLKQATP